MRIVLRILVIALLMHMSSVNFGRVAGAQDSQDSRASEQQALKTRWQREVELEHIDEAFDLAYELASLERELLDDYDEKNAGGELRDKLSRDLESTLDWVAEILENEKNEEAFEIRQEVIGLAETRVTQQDSRRISMLSTEQQEAVSRAEALEQEGNSQFREHDLAAALAKFEDAWKILDQVLGQAHTRTLAMRAWLPYLHEKQGNYVEAARWIEAELGILEKSLGRNIKTAKCSYRLALAYELGGELGKARAYCEQSLDMRRRVVGEQHVATAIARTKLGLLYLWTGKYALAKPELEKSLEIANALPPNDLMLAANLQNLALLHAMMGDFALAEPLYLRALKHAREHPATLAQVQDNIGLLYASSGNVEKAEEHYRLALAAYEQIDAKLLGPILKIDDGEPRETEESFKSLINSAAPMHRITLRKIAMTQNNLAWLFSTNDAVETAERLFRRSLLISRAIEGRNRPESAACLDNLGRLHEVMGQFAVAEQEYEQALAIRKQVLGANHIETAVSKRNLGLMKLVQGDSLAARPLLKDCLKIRRRLLDQSATVQNERQQLLMNQSLRVALDDWLSAVDEPSVYADVLRWKGAVFMRQAGLRALRQQPELKPLVDLLRKASSRLAKLSLTAPTDEKLHREQLQQLSRERERVETELVEKSEDYRRTRKQAELTPVELQSYLARAENTALIDFLEYQRLVLPEAGTPAENSESKTGYRERQFVAFVIAAKGPIQRVELGSAKAIENLVDEYRHQSLEDPFAQGAATSRTALELRRLLWQPLEPFLDGIETVLVSPDASLGKLPFASLPGKKRGTYLLEDYASAVLPVPQALPLLMDEELKEVDRAVLVLGDVDYDAVAVKKKPRRSFGQRKRSSSDESPARKSVTGYATRLSRYASLPATKSELNDICLAYEDAFDDGQISTLAEASATEEALRKLAPRHRCLHLATHGFFAPESLVSAFANRNESSRGSGAGLGGDNGLQFIGHNPGLLSGLVLAGANSPVTSDGDDGILTALEVAELDLSGVELAVLSACQTGLGSVAGGEGLLGLQRSFQIAGARTVVATLWEVNDNRTSGLMRDFYNQFWYEDLDKIQALRNAQLAMLNSGARGIRVKKNEDAKDKRTPPCFWAPFVLSGEWTRKAVF